MAYILYKPCDYRALTHDAFYTSCGNRGETRCGRMSYEVSNYGVIKFVSYSTVVASYYPENRLLIIINKNYSKTTSKQINLILSAKPSYITVIKARSTNLLEALSTLHLDLYGLQKYGITMKKYPRVFRSSVDRENFCEKYLYLNNLTSSFGHMFLDTYQANKDYQDKAKKALQYRLFGRFLQTDIDKIKLVCEGGKDFWYSNLYSDPDLLNALKNKLYFDDLINSLYRDKIEADEPKVNCVCWYDTNSCKIQTSKGMSFSALTELLDNIDLLKQPKLEDIKESLLGKTILKHYNITHISKNVICIGCHSLYIPHLIKMGTLIKQIKESKNG